MKNDIKRSNDVCRKNRMTKEERYKFSDYVHDLKESGHGGSGKGGDFTFAELDALAQDFLGDIDENQDG